MSKRLFFARMRISAFALKQGVVPLNPFMIFDYFLGEMTPRDRVREANNTLVQRADEIWVFGSISDGVLAEIQLAQERGKPLRFFTEECEPIEFAEAPFEEEVAAYRDGGIQTHDLFVPDEAR